MSTVKPTPRRLAFHLITASVDDEPISTLFQNTIKSIINNSKTNRKYKFNEEKFAYLSKATFYDYQERHHLTIKSAKKGYRIPLVDSDTLEERENPKTQNEGEANKTHVVLKPIDNTAMILIIEKGGGCITIDQVLEMIKIFSGKMNPPYFFQHELLVKENFLAELDGLQRGSQMEVIIDKSILGSKALEYSERLGQVKEDVKLIISAERNRDIIPTVKDFFREMNADSTEIKRIRLKGTNAEKNIVYLNTDLIERQEYVKVKQNVKTKVIKSKEIFDKMDEILQSYS